MTSCPRALRRSRITTPPCSPPGSRAERENSGIRSGELVGCTGRRGSSIRGGERQMTRAGVSPRGHGHCRRSPGELFSPHGHRPREPAPNRPGATGGRWAPALLHRVAAEVAGVRHGDPRGVMSLRFPVGFAPARKGRPQPARTSSEYFVAVTVPAFPVNPPAFPPRGGRPGTPGPRRTVPRGPRPAPRGRSTIIVAAPASRIIRPRPAEAVGSRTPPPTGRRTAAPGRPEPARPTVRSGPAAGRRRRAQPSDA